MIIYVIDTETTNKENVGNMEDIVEIGITKVDLEEKSIEKVYDEIIGYDLDEVYWGKKPVWIFKNSTLNREDVDIAKSKDVKPVEVVAREVREIVKDKNVTSYNVAFDFGSFLRHSPWFLNNDHTRPGTLAHRNKEHGLFDTEKHLDFVVAPCIMVTATSACKIPGYYGYKWPTLDEAFDILGIEDLDIKLDEYSMMVSKDDNKRHRAYYDTVQASMVLLALYEQGHYDVSGLIQD